MCVPSFYSDLTTMLSFGAPFTIKQPSPRVFPGDTVVKNLTASTGITVRSLVREDPLEKGMAARSSIPCLGNPMDRGAWWATVNGVAKQSDATEQVNNNSDSGHD